MSSAPVLLGSTSFLATQVSPGTTEPQAALMSELSVARRDVEDDVDRTSLEQKRKQQQKCDCQPEFRINYCVELKEENEIQTLPNSMQRYRTATADETPYAQRSNTYTQTQEMPQNLEQEREAPPMMTVMTVMVAGPVVTAETLDRVGCGF